MIFEEINGIQTGSGLKIVIYGQEGVGKSTLASQFPGAVFIDCEGSTSRMNVRRLPKPTSWKMFTDEFEYILSSCKANGYKTAIVDTFDWAERLALEALCTEHNVTGIEGMNYGKGWEYEKEMIGRFLDGTDRLIKEGVNIVLLCHAISRKTTLPEETEEFDHWELKLGNKTTNKIAPLLKEWSDMTLFLAFRTNIIAVDDKGKKHKATSCERIMYTTKTAWWDAKNRFGLPDELPLDFKEIAHIIQASAPEQKTSVPATPTPVAEAKPKATTKTASKAKSIEDEKPITADSNIEEFKGWTAHEKSWYRVGGDVYEFLKGELIPPEIAKDGIPITEDVYRGMIQNKAKENVKTSDSTKTAADEYQEPDMRIPKKLRDLMIASKINEWEIKDLVGAKGYFPADMPVADYPPEFIDGWCIGYWDQVKTSIMEIRQKQAYEFK